MNTSEIFDFAVRTLAEYGLLEKSWRVEWDNGKRRAGACHYNRRVISLSRHILPTAPDAEVRETILHEVAHALTPGHSHDAVWRAKLVEMGGTGARTHTMETPKGRYEMHCSNCGVVGNRHQAQGTWKRNVGAPNAIVYYLHRKCGTGKLWLVDTGAATTPDLLLRQAVAASKKADETIAEATKLLACTCGCGGTTKGGRFLPGHDARYVSEVFGSWLKTEIDTDSALDLMPTGALRAKLEKRIAAYATKHYKEL